MLWIPVVSQATELTLWHTWRGAEAEALTQLSEAWGAQNDVQVRLIALPFGAFDSKLETAVPRGNGPDLFLAGHGALGKWTAMSLIQPVDDSLTGHRDSARSAVSLNGQTWGYPLAVKSVVLLYDPSRITTPPKTTDELLSLAREHTHDDQFGLAYQSAEPYFHASIAHGFDAWTVPADGSPVVLNNDAHVQAMDFARGLSVDAGVSPIQPTAELIGRLYDEGKVAFVISGPWFVADASRPIAAAPLPIISQTGEPMRPFLTVDAAFVAVGAKQPALANRLAKYLADAKGAQVRQDVGKQAVSLQGVQGASPLLQVFADQAELAVLMPADPAMDSIFEAQARGLRGVMRGASTSQLAADSAQTYYDILSRPPPPPTNPWPWIGVFALLFLAGLGWIARTLSDPELRAHIREHIWDYVWIAPAGIAMSILVFVPFLTGASVSLFAHWRGEWTFVGFRHFLDILLSRDWPLTSPLSFGFTLAVTLLWTVTNVALHVGLGVSLALVLREPWIRLRPIWRGLLIIPWAIPNYITALIWKGMFHAQYGAINAVLGVVLMLDGPAEIDWFGSFATAFCANLATNTWLGFPFMMVVTLGALQSIPRELEEAAEVDGADYFFRFRHVVWPLLRPALMPAIILGSVWTFNMFNVVYLVSGGEPNSGTEILISDAYRWAFSRGNRYGYAAAYAVIIFGVLLAYSNVANRLAGKKVL
ncbi:MAG: extracellular solute-binding protein [Rhodobacterales bacterium]|nr:extracellular solute-binding protein [Rhodobacterales bacterium]